MAVEERYQIEKEISSGPTGVVYAAYDETMGRKVALRRLFPEISHEKCVECRAIFNQIMGNLSVLRSPGLIQVIDGGLDEKGYYLVTELLNGPTLGERIAKEPLNLDQFSELAKSLLGTISELHSHNIYHTTISSQSIQSATDAVKGVRFKIVDLGLGALIRSLDPLRRARHYGLIEPVLMPPEYFEGKLPSQSLDLYSCGQLLFASLVGGHPLGELGMDETYDRLREGAFPDVQTFRKDVPVEISKWIAKMTAFSVDRRYSSVAAALEAFPRLESSKDVKLVRTTRRVSVVSPPRSTARHGYAAGSRKQVHPAIIQNRVPAGSLWLRAIGWLFFLGLVAAGLVYYYEIPL